MSNIICYEIQDIKLLSPLKIKDGYTINKKYVGHYNDIPVYINNLLKIGEIKEIMNNTTMKELNPGTYQAFVEQVYDKTNENDPNKKYKIIELEVKGQTDRQYKTLFLEGYSDIALKIAQETINGICETFNITSIEELAGNEVTIVVKKNKDGFTNIDIYPKSKFYEFKFDCEIPCKVIKFYEKNNKYIFPITFILENQEYTDFVIYRKDNEWDQKSFSYVLQRCKIGLADIDKPLNIDAKLKVKLTPSKKNPEIIFTNKSITFPRIQKSNHWQ